MQLQNVVTNVVTKCSYKMQLQMQLQNVVTKCSHKCSYKMQLQNVVTNVVTKCSYKCSHKMQLQNVVTKSKQGRKKRKSKDQNACLCMIVNICACEVQQVFLETNVRSILTVYSIYYYMYFCEDEFLAHYNQRKTIKHWLTLNRSNKDSITIKLLNK